MKKNLWKLFFGAMFAFAATAFVGCVDDNEDTEAPFLDVSPTTLVFSVDGKPVDGGASAFTVATNRYWIATVEGDKTWVTLSAEEGEGSATIQVSIPENINDEAKVTVTIWNQVGPLMSQTVTIKSGNVKPSELIYYETFGTGTASSVAAYTGWETSGVGSDQVTYVGNGTDIRNNLPSTGTYSNYPGSGGSNLMFGTGETYFTVQQINLPENQRNYELSFGASYYSAPNIDIYDQLTVYLSADGETWTDAMPYAFENFKAAMNWNLASLNFTIKDYSPTLYIKFQSEKKPEGNYRIDDVKLVTGNGGGMLIDLGGNPGAPQVSPLSVKLGNTKDATVTLTVTSTTAWSAKTTGSGFTIDKLNGAGSGTITVTAAADNATTSDVALGTIVVTNAAGEKTVQVSQLAGTGNAYFHTNVGTKALDKDAPWPTVSNYDDWQATGSGVSTVTFGGTDKTTIRNSGLSSTGAYDGASGPNSVHFGTLPAYFTINNITVPASQTNMKLTFGGNRSIKVGAVYDNVFKKENFLVSLSANGTTWVPVTYTINNGDQTEPFWVFATADFTLKAGTSAIYVKFEATEASAFRVDDITLAPGTGGQQIDLGGGGSTPSVATASYTKLKDVSVTLGGSLANAEIANYSAVGVQYILFSTGTVNDINWANATKKAATTKATPWTVDVTALTAETQYAYRAYATPSTGTELYGEARTFVTTKTGGSATPISIADLIGKMTTTATAVDKDYEIEGVICSDPAGLNFSFGTLYVMTSGATTGGNALSLYNTKVITADYALGDKVKVTLTSGVAKIYKRNDVPQVEGFDPLAIEVVSKGNTVTPVKVTLAQLASYVCMPVTIENATTPAAGVWKEAGALKNTTLNVAGTNFTVNVNKNATLFDGQAYAATTGSITGIVSIFQSAGQLMPRNLNDVKAFNPSADAPTITAVDPTSVSFEVAGGTKTIAVTVANMGSNTLSATGLSGILAATVSGTTVTVMAQANTGSEVSQTLTIAVSGGNSVTVPVKVAGTGGGTSYTLISDIASLTAGKYYMAGYVDTAAPYVYQMWTGAVSFTGSGTTSNSDLKTVPYQFSAGQLTPEEASVSTEVELVAVSGQANTYYIKVGDKYLYNSVATTNRRLYFQDAPVGAEWVFIKKSNGDGVTASNNGTYLITAAASSDYIRSYKTETQTKVGIFFFKKN